MRWLALAVASLSWTAAAMATATITGVSGPSSGVYGPSRTATITVTYDSPVTVTGTPTIGMRIGSTSRAAAFAEASSSTTLTFRYATQAGDNGALQLASEITLNGGSIRDGTGAAASLTFTPPDTSGVTYDTTPPTVTGWTQGVIDSTNPNIVKFGVSFSEPVTGFAAHDLVFVITGHATAAPWEPVGDGTGVNYVVPVTFSGSGTMKITVSGGTMAYIRDAAGNIYPGSDVSVTYTLPNQDSPVITSSLQADATVGTPFTYTITATGSPTSYTATTTATWLTFDGATHTLSGTPTAAATSSVSLSATNSTGTGNATLTIAVHANVNSGAPVVHDTVVPGIVGQPITPVQVQAEGSPTSFSAPDLPRYGLSIDNTGLITGTPIYLAQGVKLSMTATNAAGTSAPATINLDLNPPHTVSNDPPPPFVHDAAVSGIVGQPITPVQVQADGSPTSFSAPDLPKYGLSIDNHGLIAGTPIVVAQGVKVTMTATGATGTSAPATITLDLNPPHSTNASAQVPVIHDTLVTGTVGQPIQTVQVQSENSPTSFSAPDLAKYGLTIDSTGVVSGTPTATAQAARVSMTASNAAGTSVSELITLDISPAPNAVTAPTGVPIVHNVTVTGQVGVAIAPVQVTAENAPTKFNAAGLSLYGLAIDHSGRITGTPTAVTSSFLVSVTATNDHGTSAPAIVTLNLAAADQPKPAASFTSDKPVDFGTAPTPAPVTYTVVSGPGTVVDNQLVFTGSGTVVVKATETANATAPAGEATLTFSAVPVDRLVNLSARMHLNGGATSSPGIVGFVVTGDAPKSILVRAVGPSLGQFGVSDFAPALRLALFDSAGKQIAANANWSNDAAITAASTAVGAFSLLPDSHDAAVLITLAPGAYTAVVDTDTGGTALLEVYDATANAAVPTKQLVNLSARGTIDGTTNALIAGFVVSGGSSKRVLIRGVGPALAQFGVSGTLQDPTLTVYNGAHDVVAENNDWGAPLSTGTIASTASESEIVAATDSAGAFQLPHGSADAVAILTLAPGSYSAVVTSRNGGSGTALVEVYELADAPK